MHTVVILLAGVTVVVGGIVVLRLHAFVSLMLAALLVALLTPVAAVRRASLLPDSRRVTAVGDQLEFQSGSETAIDGDWVLFQVDSDGQIQPISTGTAEPSGTNGATTAAPTQNGAMTAAPAVEGVKSPHRSLRFVHGAGGARAASASNGALYVTRPAALQSSARTAAESAVGRVTSEFGTNCGKLGLLIVAAAIIGGCLLESGAAERIVASILHACGERLAPLGFALSGFLLAVPVFFDTVFLLMVPLAQSMQVRTGRNYLLYVLAIMVGGMMAHSLVPPTPGPLLIVSQFGLEISHMMLGGTIIGLAASAGGLVYAYWLNRRNVLSLIESEPPSVARLHESPGPLPSLATALLPIGLPVILMTVGSSYVKSSGRWLWGALALPAGLSDVLQTVSDRNIAMLLGAASALMLLLSSRRGGRHGVSTIVRRGVESAATIILVTAAGAAFGQAMKQTSVTELLHDLPTGSPEIIVMAAFAVTTLVRTAQGSATVAMMTAAGIFSGLVTSGAAGVHPLYVALAVGCGSKPFSWMNDSGFLVITRMSGMTESQGLRFVTSTTGVLGLSGLLAILLAMQILPLI